MSNQPLPEDIKQTMEDKGIRYALKGVYPGRYSERLSGQSQCARDRYTPYMDGIEDGYSLALPELTRLREEIEALEATIADYDKKLIESRLEGERLRDIIYYTNKSWHCVFYQNTSKMTAREIHDFWMEELPKFKLKHNLK
jgi:hypothetical protein